MTDAVVAEAVSPVEEVVPRKLSGLEKAVVFFRFLGIEEIKAVLRFLDRSDVEKISRNMTKIDAIDQKELIKIVQEFQQESSGVFLPDSAEDKAKFFLEHFDEIQMASSPEGKKRSQLTHLYALEKASAEKIAALFKDDHHQLIALVLSQLTPKKSKEILALFEVDKRNDILKRIAMLKDIDHGALSTLDEALQTKINTLIGNEAQAGGPSMAANILSCFPEEESKVFMETVKEKHEPLFQKINQFYITFSDIVALENSTLQKILTTVEPQLLAQALCKSPKEVKDKCFSVITKRAVTLIEDELKSLTQVLPEVVQEAQQVIIRSARELEAERKISLGKK